MFYHSQADDLVVSFRLSEVAVVYQFDLASSRKISFRNPLLRQNELLLAECDPNSIHAILACSVHDQSTPPAANIQQPFASLQPQFSANVVDLLALRGVEIIFRLLEVSTGVDHLLAQPERIEIVRNIVVIANRLPVALFRVKPPAQPRPTPHYPQLAT